MDVGVVGLGRMGSGIAERLRSEGHTVVGHDSDAAISETATLSDLVHQLDAPRVLWVMVPAGDPTESVLDELRSILAAGDTVIEAGNSRYTDSIRRAAEFAGVGVPFLDAGVSGGVWGREHGFCLMVGGDPAVARSLQPIFDALATPGGYAHVGPSGAGHYVKMVHNGIEYALLQAYAEGFELLDSSDFDLDLPGIASLWNEGSVIRSWLLELAGRALEGDPGLDQLQGHVDDSGEGRWTVIEAVERGVPAGAIAQALFARFASRDDNPFSMRLIAALRREFGSHPVRDS